jgi:hypothetical protein
VVYLVKALHYKPESRRFSLSAVIEIFHRHNPSGHPMALGLTQLLTEISTRNISLEVRAAGE